MNTRVMKGLILFSLCVFSFVSLPAQQRRFALHIAPVIRIVPGPGFGGAYLGVGYRPNASNQVGMHLELATLPRTSAFSSVIIGHVGTFFHHYIGQGQTRPFIGCGFGYYDIGEFLSTRKTKSAGLLARIGVEKGSLECMMDYHFVFTELEGSSTQTPSLSRDASQLNIKLGWYLRFGNRL